MFGFRGGESAEVVRRKKDHMADAQARWPFLTHFDASTIKNDRQLATMLKERCSTSWENAESDVRQWMRGKVF
jgi:hypothetical protein